MASRYLRKAWLAVTLMPLAYGQLAILQIRVIEGEGAVHSPGARSARPLTVEITDETGRPVPDAAVSFRVPDEGPGGSFLNGLRTIVATTDARGRASVRGLQVNRFPGRFQIRIFASKEQARAGIVSFQYIGGTGAPQPVSRAPYPISPPVTAPAAARAPARGRGKWVAMAVLAGGGAVAGILAAGRSAPAAPPVVIPQPPALSIGPPSITVGTP